jgi:hypothetical protein
VNERSKENIIIVADNKIEKAISIKEKNWKSLNLYKALELITIINA